MVGLNVFSVRVAIAVGGCAGVVDGASVALAASFRAWDLWARIMFPRRFVGNEYFVTMRVWDLLLVWWIWIGIWDWGGVHCCPLWGTRCGRLDGGLAWEVGSGAYCVWVRL